jgi:hypothetical protein
MTFHHFSHDGGRVAGARSAESQPAWEGCVASFHGTVGLQMNLALLDDFGNVSG